MYLESEARHAVQVHQACVKGTVANTSTKLRQRHRQHSVGEQVLTGFFIAATHFDSFLALNRVLATNYLCADFEVVVRMAVQGLAPSEHVDVHIHYIDIFEIGVISEKRWDTTYKINGRTARCQCA